VFFKSVPNPESYVIKDNNKKYNSIFIKQYSDGISNIHIEDPLLFWKENETKYPELSKLAKKFLGVPASEADEKRMFNILIY